MDRLLNTREAARYLRISKTQLYKLLYARKLKGYKLTPNSTRSEWRIKKEDIEEYLKGLSNVPV